MGVWVTSGTEPTVIAHSEKEQYNSDGLVAFVTLEVPWENRHAVMQDILGTPLIWPYNTSLGMYAANGVIVPLQGEKNAEASNLNVYTHARLNINFSRTYGDEGDGSARYYETIEPTGEMLRLPQESVHDSEDDWQFKWGEAAASAILTAEEAPSRLIIGMDYVVKWVKLSSVPAAVLTIVDHVNNASIVSPSLGLTFPAETLLANSPVINRTVGYGGSGTSDLEIRYSFRADGWNKFWNPRTSAFESVWVHSPNTPPTFAPYEYINFPLADMSPLLP
jgi:hypothetical protein